MAAPLRRLWGDARRIGAGLASLLYCAACRREPGLGLSVFLPLTATAVPGGANAYDLAIYNGRGHGCWVLVVLDLYTVNDGERSGEHLGFFAKRVYLRPNRPETVRIVFDWVETLRFQIQGVLFDPDDRSGVVGRGSGRCRLKASLETKDRRSVESLMLVQEVGVADR